MPPRKYGDLSPEVGMRVEISPHYDLWMMGAKFGTITKVKKDGTNTVKHDHDAVRFTKDYPTEHLRRAT